MDVWEGLADILVLLWAALALGILAERLRQSAIIGYLAAGVLVGPQGLKLVSSAEHISAIAELGVTLLLFTIGLEFSFSRLRRTGPITFVGGSGQLLITGLLAGAVALRAGVDGRAAVAIGAMVALSSTACVVRVLTDTAQTDSVSGRSAIGILLLQDIAVVPLVLLVSALGKGTVASGDAWVLGRTMLLGVALCAGAYVLVKYAAPVLLHLPSWWQNRELAILFAVGVALGSASSAHYAGLSPSLGAFVSGMLLGDSPFAVQIRADTAALRTLLLTLFFAAVGLLADPQWTSQHMGLVALVVALIVVGKGAIVWGVMRLFRYGNGPAAATAACLAQVGEFSFLLANIAVLSGVITEHLFRLVVTATLITLFLTPYLVRGAPGLARLAGAGWRVRQYRRGRDMPEATCSETPEAEPCGLEPRILVVGFGPSGQRVAGVLLPEHRDRLVVVDVNPHNATAARSYGLESHVGDATHQEVLRHLHIERACAVVVTLPDPVASCHIIQLCRSLAPAATIVARARYHVHQSDLWRAGADAVVDEEVQIGEHLAAEVLRALEGFDSV